MFCAFDLETTGLNPMDDQILQVGAVLFTKDGVVDRFNELVCHERYHGEPFALQMNAKLLQRLAAGEGKRQFDVVVQFQRWIDDNKANNAHPVGFNVAGFDLVFFKLAYRDYWGRYKSVPLHHRPIELGSVFATEEGLPASSSATVKQYLQREVTHDALQDAQDAAELYMGRLNGKW